MNPVKALVVRWVREEHARVTGERQAACDHARSGTMRGDPPVVVCNDCDKELAFTGGAGMSPVEQRGVDAMRGAR